MNLVAALLSWLFQLPPLQAMRWGARSLLKYTLLALVDPETLAPRQLDQDYLGYLYRGVCTAADLIDCVIGARVAELTGIAERKSRRWPPGLPTRACDQAAMIRRVCALLHRLDHLEAAAVRVVRRIEAERADAQRHNRVAGAPVDETMLEASVAAHFVQPICAVSRALELSG